MLFYLISTAVLFVFFVTGLVLKTKSNKELVGAFIQIGCLLGNMLLLFLYTFTHGAKDVIEALLPVATTFGMIISTVGCLPQSKR